MSLGDNTPYPDEYRLLPNEEVPICGRFEGWYLILSHGHEGWVKGTYTILVNVEPWHIPLISPTDRCNFTSSDHQDERLLLMLAESVEVEPLRIGPSTQFDVLGLEFSLKSGEKAAVLGRNCGWYYIIVHASEGWINGPSTKLINANDTQIPFLLDEKVKAGNCELIEAE